MSDAGIGKKRCAVLHIGTSKTGTTSLQYFLAANYDALAARGMLYAKAGRSGSGQHQLLVKALRGDSEPSDSETIFSALDAECARVPHDTLIISSERLSSIFLHSLDILSFFEERGYEVFVVCYLRHQPQYLNSRYAQDLKKLNRAKTFTDFIRKSVRKAEYDYRNYLKLLARLDGNAVFRPFNATVRQRGVEVDFLCTVGILPERASWDADFSGEAIEASMSGLRKVPNRNITHNGPLEIEAARLIGARMNQNHRSDKRPKREARRLLRHAIQGEALSEVPYCGLTTEIARDIETRFHEANSTFAEAVWGTSWARVFAGDYGREFVANDVLTSGTPESVETASRIVEAVSTRTLARSEA